MKRYEITIAAKDVAQEGYVLQAASKIISELQAMGTGCRLIAAEKPWQIAMVGMAEDPDFIERQVCDLIDGRRGTIKIRTA